MDKKLQTTHLYATRYTMLIDLLCVQIELQKSPYVLKEAVLWFVKVNEREQDKHQAGFPIVCLLKHVQTRVWLTDQDSCSDL